MFKVHIFRVERKIKPKERSKEEAAPKLILKSEGLFPTFFTIRKVDDP